MNSVSELPKTRCMFYFRGNEENKNYVTSIMQKFAEMAEGAKAYVYPLSNKSNDNLYVCEGIVPADTLASIHSKLTNPSEVKKIGKIERGICFENV